MPPTHLHLLSLHYALPIFVAKFGRSLPPAKSFHQAAPICETGGINAESQNRPATSHRTMSDASDRMLVLRRLDIFKDRKSTRLNSSHLVISYAVFCLKKKR